MITRRLEIVLSDTEEDFVRWMAKRDGVSYRMELSMIFNTELSHLMDMYEAEKEMESQK